MPGLCPCCKVPERSTFLQSIHSNELFQILRPHGDFGRSYLFCNVCIGWAKEERKKRKQAIMSQQSGTVQSSGLVQPEIGFCSSLVQPTDHVQPTGLAQPPPQPLPVIQQQYSPISEPSPDTPEPFNMPLLTAADVIGARLANPNDSPIHGGK